MKNNMKPPQTCKITDVGRFFLHFSLNWAFQVIYVDFFEEKNSLSQKLIQYLNII